MFNRTIIAVFIAFLACSCEAESPPPPPFQAKIVGVTDGDTVTALTMQKKEVKVRLSAIDAPESKQDFGTQSKKALSDLVFSKTVIVRPTGTDRYGRTLAFLIDGETNVNAVMIHKGMAHHYRQYSDSQTLQQLENLARNARKGLWSDPHALPPWEWRSLQKAKRKALAK